MKARTSTVYAAFHIVHSSLSKNFVVYQYFNREEDLREVAAVLEKVDIPVRISDDTKDRGSWTERTIMGSPLRPRFWIEIPEASFSRANFMLQEFAEARLREADILEHPFFHYDIAALQQVLVEESDWSPEAVVIARRLLLRRGGDVDLKRLRTAARARTAAAYVPAKANRWLLALQSWLAIVGGLLLWLPLATLATGWLCYVALGTRRDPQGKRHPAYTLDSQRLAQIGLSLLTVSVLVGLGNFFVWHWYSVVTLDSWLWWWR